MKIINREEIQKAAKECVDWNGDSVTYVGFQKGVEFAESKLEEIAIEFADWILNKNDPGFNITTKIERGSENQSLKDGRKEIPVWGHTRLGYGKTFTSKELFEQFIKERNEK